MLFPTPVDTVYLSEVSVGKGSHSQNSRWWLNSQFPQGQQAQEGEKEDKFFELVRKWCYI